MHIAGFKTNNQTLISKAVLVSIWVNNYIDLKQTDEEKKKEFRKLEVERLRDTHD